MAIHSEALARVMGC